MGVSIKMQSLNEFKPCFLAAPRNTFDVKSIISLILWDSLCDCSYDLDERVGFQQEESTVVDG